MNNPIIRRELVGLLRTRKAMFLQIGLAVVCALLVLIRWPGDSLADLSGARSLEVFRVFAYGLLATILLLVPAFPATSIVREKNEGTLALLFNSPMRPWSIYFGKLGGMVAFVLLVLSISFPAAAACYAMGGLSLTSDILFLYAILLLAAVQFAALALLVSSYANSTDSALRLTYGLVILLALVSMGPRWFLHPQSGLVKTIVEVLRDTGLPAGWLSDLPQRIAWGAEWLRCLSPIPAVMELVGHGDVGTQGLGSAAGAPFRYTVLALVTTGAFMLRTMTRLNHRMFDRPRDQGKVTDERSTGVRWLRRIFFLVDPQRRKAGIAPLVNPVMVKEFRCRRFGRLHWLFRLVAFCAVISLGLTYVSSSGVRDWSVETIGGLLVMLQVALIVLVTPSLAAGLISGERESGGWQLLQMTPLSAGVIVRGKLLSVVWTLLLILLATLPGYVVMMYIKPTVWWQVWNVLISLLLTATFAVLVSAAVSSLFSRTAPATATAYAILITVCAGTMLVWLARDAPFGHSTVESVLSINPMAAALSVIEMRGFAEYNLVPVNWWIMGGASVFCFVVLTVQTWRLTRPQ